MLQNRSRSSSLSELIGAGKVAVGDLLWHFNSSVHTAGRSGRLVIHRHLAAVCLRIEGPDCQKRALGLRDSGSGLCTRSVKRIIGT